MTFTAQRTEEDSLFNEMNGPDPDGIEATRYISWNISGHDHVRKVVYMETVYLEPTVDGYGVLSWDQVDDYLNGDAAGIMVPGDELSPVDLYPMVHMDWYAEDAEGERLYDYDVEDVVGFTEDQPIFGQWERLNQGETVDEKFHELEEFVTGIAKRLNMSRVSFDPLDSYLIPMQDQM